MIERHSMRLPAILAFVLLALGDIPAQDMPLEQVLIEGEGLSLIHI